MKRWLSALLFAGVLASAGISQAQEVQIRGPLAGASACRRCVLYREGRFSIAPTFGLTLQDEYSRAFMIGAQANYHFSDGIALGIWGAGAISFDSPLTGRINGALLAPGAMLSTPNIPNAGDAANPTFSRQIGRLNFIITPQLTGIPLRGKLALFQNIFIDTDFYLFAGVAIAGVTERAPINTSTFMQPRVTGMTPELIDNQTQRRGRVAVGPTFGVGLNFFINRFLSISFEYRAFPFAWNVAGTDEYSRGVNTCGRTNDQGCNAFPDYQVRDDGAFIIDGNDATFKFNQMINLAVNFFLPPEARISR